MKDLINLFVFISILHLFSCKENKNNDKIEEIKFRYYNLENAGWKSKLYNQKVENINYTATEVPIQYYLLKSEGNSNLIGIDSIYEKNKFERVYEFTFHDENEDDLLKYKHTNMDFEDSVKYLSFNIDKDYFLVTSKNDTVKCSGVLFERTFKITPYNKVLLFFSGINPNEKVQLVYKDNLFRKGILKFRFEEPILNL